MTRLIIESDNTWTKEKIKGAIFTEISILRKTTDKIKDKLKRYEDKYGKFNRNLLYGKIDDLELIEWEGEIETLERLQNKLKSLEEITFEYK